jgi:hypothetical protein
MKHKTRFSISILAMMLVLASSASQSQVPTPPVEAKPGTVATGSIQSERDGKLYLNTTPCKSAAEARIVIFHEHYQKTAAGTVDCYPARFDVFTVEQQ